MTSLKLSLKMWWIYVHTFNKKSCLTKRWSSRLTLGQGNTQHLYIKPYNITKCSQTLHSAIVQTWWHSSQLEILLFFWQLHSSVIRCSTTADYSTICRHHVLVRLNPQLWTAHIIWKRFLSLDQAWYMNIPPEQCHFPLICRMKLTFSPNFLIQITVFQMLNF